MKYREEITGLGILISMWGMMAVVSLIAIISSAELMGLYVLLAFVLIMTMVYIPSLIKTLRIRKVYRNIIDNGIKTQGKIVNYSIDMHNRRRSYSVTVTYIDPYTWKEMQISTPALSFDPVSALGDDICSVYILDDSYYVTDFVPRKANQENIWGKEIDTLEIKEIKKVVIGVTIFILFFILICLCCVGVINF